MCIARHQPVAVIEAFKSAPLSLLLAASDGLTAKRRSRDTRGDDAGARGHFIARVMTGRRPPPCSRIVTSCHPSAPTTTGEKCSNISFTRGAIRLSRRAGPGCCQLSLQPTSQPSSFVFVANKLIRPSHTPSRSTLPFSGQQKGQLALRVCSGDKRGFNGDAGALLFGREAP